MVLLYPDGRTEHADVYVPDLWSAHEWFKRVVAGFFSIERFGSSCFVQNTEPRILGLPLNVHATTVASHCGCVHPFHGTVILLSEQEAQNFACA